MAGTGAGGALNDRPDPGLREGLPVSLTNTRGYGIYPDYGYLLS